MKPLVLGAAACAAMFACSVSAHAQTAPMDECLWTNTPAATRDALAAAAPSPVDVSAVFTAKVDGALLGQVLTACKGPMDASGSVLVRNVLIAHALQAGGLDKLKAKQPAAQATLDAKWSAYPQTLRDRFSDIFDPTRHTLASDEDYNREILALMDGLMLARDDGSLLYAYLGGRSELEYLRRTMPAAPPPAPAPPPPAPPPPA